ncbi:hypothetical protein GCM10011571_22630 [Marinithermofilum abyssi]|uniref:Uncharacterized protein n=1 Tax=Marinithermofilum abyssi TaxID=1571185 RepID=A0A8J2YCZ8_9BACL|nr:hypothetical protein [Marinithermofilum abyssi]GGE20156.1 hypothetical protein GCM10011571_22630 [Marinithermofilum abyssi]
MNQKDLHQRVTQLQALIDSGQIRFEKPSVITDSWSKVEFGNDGLVKPESVDANVHALLTVAEVV